MKPSGNSFFIYSITFGRPELARTGSCQICLEELSLASALIHDTCRHGFCRNCFNQYLETKFRDLNELSNNEEERKYTLACPMCREAFAFLRVDDISKSAMRYASCIGNTQREPLGVEISQLRDLINDIKMNDKDSEETAPHWIARKPHSGRLSINDTLRFLQPLSSRSFAARSPAMDNKISSLRGFWTRGGGCVQQSAVINAAQASPASALNVRICDPFHRIQTRYAADPDFEAISDDWLPMRPTWTLSRCFEVLVGLLSSQVTLTVVSSAQELEVFIAEQEESPEQVAFMPGEMFHSSVLPLLLKINDLEPVDRARLAMDQQNASCRLGELTFSEAWYDVVWLQKNDHETEEGILSPWIALVPRHEKFREVLKNIWDGSIKYEIS